MTHSPRRLAFAALFAALIVDHALADDDPWIGKRVITIDGAVLMDGDKVVAASVRDHGSFFVYRVEKVDGTRVRLVAENGSRSGWAPAANVLTLDQAIEYFSRQIETDPTESKHFLDRAAIRIPKEEFDSAIADLNEVIRLDPKYGTAYFLRGSARASRHEYEKAIGDLTEAIRLDPNDALAYANRGSTYLFMRDYDEAITDFNEAVRLRPSYLFAYGYRGVAWSFKKEHDRAIADFNEVIRLDPGDAMAYLNRGLARTAKQEFAKAVADFNEAIGVDPRAVLAYQARASIWATCPDKSFRDGKKALESATKACELTDWKRPEMFRTLADAYAESGDYSKAREWQDKANKFINFEQELAKIGEGLKPRELRLPKQSEVTGTGRPESATAH